MALTRQTNAGPAAPRIVYEDAFQVIEPHINSAGIHNHPFDPAFPADVRFCSFEKARRFRLNRHEYYELLHVQSGEVAFQVQDRRVLIREGELFVMGSTLLHGASGCPKGKAKAAVLYFLPHLICGRENAGEDVQYLVPFLAQDGRFPHVVPATAGIPAQVFELMKMAAADLPATTERRRLSVRTYVKMMLVLLVNHFAGFAGNANRQARREQMIERLNPLFDYVDRHYREPVTVHEAAAVLHMSKSNFMRLFRNVTGQSFITFLNHFRIAKAEVLLVHSDRTIAEIGQDVGFGDQSYFGRMFRSVQHKSPRQYRLEMAKAAQAAS